MNHEMSPAALAMIPGVSSRFAKASLRGDDPSNSTKVEVSIACTPERYAELKSDNVKSAVAVVAFGTLGGALVGAFVSPQTSGVKLGFGASSFTTLPQLPFPKIYGDWKNIAWIAGSVAAGVGAGILLEKAGVKQKIVQGAVSGMASAGVSAIHLYRAAEADVEKCKPAKT